MAKKCVHRWRLEEPHGTTLIAGVCQNCGREKKYRASAPDNVEFTIRRVPRGRK